MHSGLDAGQFEVPVGCRIAVAIPAHNEERHVAGTITSVPRFVDRVIVVDDASTDATHAEAVRAASMDPRVFVLRHSTNLGVGAAIATAFRVALREGMDVIGVMDGDGQMHPDDLPALLAPVISGSCDVAKGYRFDGVRPRGPMPLPRVVGNLVLSAATKLAAGVSGRLDAQCGYVVVGARALRKIDLDALYPRYGFPNDLLLRLLGEGCEFVSVPVRAVYGSEVSGIRAHVAIPRILGVLARAFVRRLAVDTAAPRELEADEL